MHVAEQLVFENTFAQPGAVECDQTLLSPATVQVNRPGDQFLTRSTLAGDEHGHIALRHLPGGADDVLHGGAFADDPFEIPLAREQLLLHRLVLLLQRCLLRGPIHLLAEMIQIQRLFDVVVRPFVQRLLAGRDIRMGRHQNHRRRRDRPAC